MCACIIKVFVVYTTNVYCVLKNRHVLNKKENKENHKERKKKNENQRKPMQKNGNSES